MSGPGRGRARLALSLQVATRSRGLPSATQLRGWARAALRKPARVCLRIVTAREGESLNRAYRRKDCPTNVLTFRYDDEHDTLAGDIVLCAPVIRREARAQGKALLAHYAHLTVHALLHLQGYDHALEREARIMEARETSIMRSLGYPDPYAIEPTSCTTSRPALARLAALSDCCHGK
ncbi:MAG: rRNA maturation RNase YbeY [Betaproteobacteria bacterium]|nr:rRNA maturation RNase YbeY [Betaproteobacteria bacterium]